MQNRFSSSLMFLVITYLTMYGVALGQVQLTFERLDIDIGTGASPRALVTLDLDDNGTRDLVVTNITTLSVLNNNGNGIFSIPFREVSTGGTALASTVAADLDGDGREEVIVPDPGGSALQVFRRNNSGVLEFSFRITGLSQPFAVAVADFNGDNRPDLAIANRGVGRGLGSDLDDIDHGVIVLLQRNDGTFVNNIQSQDDGDGFIRPSGCCLYPNALITGDFNNDTFLDLGIAEVGGRDRSDNTERVILAQNRGPLVEAPFFSPNDQENPPPSSYDRIGLDLQFFEPECNIDGEFENEFCHTFSVTVVDLNGDTRLDLAIASEFSDDVIVPIPPIPTETDGFFDEVSALTYWAAQSIFLRAETSGALRRFTTTGAGTFIATTDHIIKGLAFSTDATPVLYSIARDDAVLRVIDPETGATVSANVTLTLEGATINGGNGLATHPVTGALWGVLRVTGGARVLVTIDPLTGVATRIGSPGDSLAGLAFDSAGTLYGIAGEGNQLENPPPPATLFMLSTADATPTFFGALRANASGQAIAFNPDSGLLYHASGVDAAVVDVSANGVFESIDLSHIQGKGTVAYFLNNGDDTFTRTNLTTVPGVAPLFITNADVDGDGRPDLIVVNRNANNISVWRNNGDGTFADAQTIAVGTQPRAVVAADLDRDGDMDLAVANQGSNNVSVLLNRTRNPVLAITPDPHDFGTALLGASNTVDFTITNHGDANLALATLRLDGTDAAEFSLEQDECSGQTLTPSTPCTVTARFTPASAGDKSASLVIPSNDPTTAEHQVALSGLGEAARPNIVVTPAAHDFGAILVGATATQEVTIQNTGTGDLVLGELAFSGAAFRLSNENCSNTTLTPEALCTVLSTFAPTAAGATNARLTIPSNDPDSPSVQVELNGVGILPMLEVTPGEHDFGIVPLQSEVRQTFTVTNSGTADLTITALSLDGPAAFAIQNNNCATLAPALTCSFEVVFTPAASGALSATLALASNDPVAPLRQVALRGTGGVTALQVSPTSHDFGTVTQGETATVTFTLTNGGTSNLLLERLSLIGTNALQFRIAADLCSNRNVPPAAHCTLDVVFVPAGVGTRVARLLIRSNDPDTPRLDLALQGAGTCPADGNVNQDAQITPNDALQILRHYLDPVTFALRNCETLRANVLNPASSGITPADALCVFRASLGMASCLGR